ncbi:MAG TPA: choice-of-anchor J domain-containing protein [Ignavibacteria bacterium]
MKKLIFTFLLLVFFSGGLFSQVKIQEGFETCDSNNLPTGWVKYNEASFPIYYSPIYSNWTVRDSGVWMPGLSNGSTRAHSGLKSCGVSWYMGFDTAQGYHIAAGWLVTKKIENIETTDMLKFWATGGSASYGDSIQVWISFIDSTPANFTNKIASIYWPNGSVYGTWTQYQYSLAGFAGLPAYIGFLYNTDQTANNNGFAVYLDDVFVGNPSSITNLGTGIPTKYELGQNYPNPFNPSTSIKFAIPKASDVKITVFNMLGQVVSVPVNENKTAGFYEVKFNGSNLASGSYYYRIEAGNFLETRKMMLIK